MKRSSLKAAAIVSAAVSLALFTAACGSSDATDKPSGPAEVTFWSWLKGSQDVADAFNASQTDVKVKFEQVPGGPDYYNKLANAVKAGNAPDIATVEYQRVPEVVSQGELQDITSLAGETVKSKFPASVQSLVNLGGKTWSVPLDSGSVVFYYRKDLFERYKIDVPKTWDDYKAAAATVKAANKDARLGTIESDANWLAALNWQAGATWFGVEGQSWKVTLDSPQAHKVADFWQGLGDTDLAWKYLTADQLTQKQKAGQVLSVISGAWQAGYLKSGLADQKGKWASAPLPTWDGSPASAMLGGSSFGVPKSSKNAAAAVKFITWMTTTPEGITARLKSGTSSALPASPDLVPVAAKNFDASFFATDIYAVAGAATPTIPAGWVWGPGMGTTTTSIADTYAKVKAGTAKIGDIYAPAQQKTIDDLKARGLSVS